MTIQNQLKQIENQIRLRSLRGWATGLAICIGATALLCLGLGQGGLLNPNVWTSTFSIMAHGGFLRQLVLPLSYINIALLVVAIIVHLCIDRTLKLDE